MSPPAATTSGGAGPRAHASDRGSQYASEHYRRVLSGQGVTFSMSRRANCGDDAPVESFFASLEEEPVHDEGYQTREEARASIFEYIEVFYNRVRRHSSLGYRSPIEYERAG
jgi:putative transposase